MNGFNFALYVNLNTYQENTIVPINDWNSAAEKQAQLPFSHNLKIVKNDRTGKNLKLLKKFKNRALVEPDVKHDLKSDIKCKINKPKSQSRCLFCTESLLNSNNQCPNCNTYTDN